MCLFFELFLTGLLLLCDGRGNFERYNCYTKAKCIKHIKETMLQGNEIAFLSPSPVHRHQR